MHETGNCITGTATALNDVQIKTQSYFKDFDFDGIWALNAAENGGYPYLKQTTMLPVSYVASTAGTVLIDNKTGGISCKHQKQSSFLRRRAG